MHISYIQITLRSSIISFLIKWALIIKRRLRREVEVWLFSVTRILLLQCMCNVYILYMCLPADLQESVRKCAIDKLGRE